MNRILLGVGIALLLIGMLGCDALPVTQAPASVPQGDSAPKGGTEPESPTTEPPAADQPAGEPSQQQQGEAVQPTPEPPAPSDAGEGRQLAWRTINQLEGLPGAQLRYINSLGVGPDGALWVGTDNDGAFRFDGERWSQYTANEGLPDNSVHAFAFGREGVIWAATWFGAARFDGQRWQAYPIEKDQVGNDFHSIAVGLDGTVWLGTGRGLMRLEGNAWQHALQAGPGYGQGEDSGKGAGQGGDAGQGSGGESAPGPALDVPVHAIWVDADGSVWYSAMMQPLNWVQQGAAQPVGPQNLPDGFRTNALLHGRDGAMVLASSHGLYRYKDGTWQTPAEGLPGGAMRCLAEGPDGALWAGTHGEGAYAYNGETWQRWTMADGLVDDIVTAMAVTPDGAVWAAGAAGLAVMEAP